MEYKMLEVRDRGTRIPVLAIGTEPNSNAELQFLSVDGWGADSVILIRMQANIKIQHDPFDWGDRTMLEAHLYIERNFERIENYSVIDVEFIKQETSKIKGSEIWK